MSSEAALFAAPVALTAVRPRAVRIPPIGFFAAIVLPAVVIAPPIG